jgi:lysophospholipase L1-like esterase
MNFATFLLATFLTISTSPLSLQVPAHNAPEESRTTDLTQPERYRTANQKILETGVPVRVVFLGDSITDYWGSRAGTWFSNSGWINRGIGGQTTAQLLQRIQRDAIDLHPQAIVLEGASNDMRSGFSPEAIRDNLLSMGKLAQAHHIAVFVAIMTPVCDCYSSLTGLRTVSRIDYFNTLLRQMCRERHWMFIDLNTPLRDKKGLMRKELTTDGVHPNDEGYRILAPVVLKALHSYQ